MGEGDEARLDLILRGGQAFLPQGLAEVDLGIEGGRIAAILAPGAGVAAEERDCRGLTLVPGIIDTQVHFREPGLEHKEDLESGSRAAVMGGVTALFEMPNTRPPTTTAEALADKLARASGRMWCDHGFYLGASPENADSLAAIECLPGCCGIKVFMGASTGDLLVPDDETLARVLASGRRRVAIHAEDEPRLRERAHLRVAGNPASHPVWRDDESAIRATRRAVTLAQRYGRRIHILHVTTPEELAFLARHKDIASVEVTPQHLTLAVEEAGPRLGTYLQMNPPIRSAAHRAGLWHWLAQGVVDVIGSDHAPHTDEEKARPYPDSPSGMPGVQTLLPLMLTHMAAGRLTLARLVDLLAEGPRRLFGIVGKGRLAVGEDADVTVIDTAAHWTVERDWLQSRCGWSPFEGMEMVGRPVGTVIRGRIVMWEGELFGPPAGRPLRFEECLKEETAQ